MPRRDIGRKLCHAGGGRKSTARAEFLSTTASSGAALPSPEVRRHAESPRRRQRPSVRLTGKRKFGVLMPRADGGWGIEDAIDWRHGGSRSPERYRDATFEATRAARPGPPDRALLQFASYCGGRRVRPPCARLDLKPFADGSAVGFCPERLPIRPARDPGPLAPQKMRQPPTVLLELGL